MTEEEAADALILAAAIDRRPVDLPEIRAWAAALTDVTLTDARTAIRALYRAGLDRRVTPAQILHWTAARTTTRPTRSPDTIQPPPGHDPDDVNAHLAWLRTQRGIHT
jgi:hypothetical protein